MREPYDKEMYHVIHATRRSLPRFYAVAFVHRHCFADEKEAVAAAKEAIHKADDTIPVESVALHYLGTAELEFPSYDPSDSLGHFVEWETNGHRIPKLVVIV